MLELFSGTGSVGKVASAMGWEVISLDRDLAANIQTDIMEWDYKTYPSGYFHFIWASPPCTEYSRANTVGVRKIEEANQVVQRTLGIIHYVRPNYWFLENPQSGLLQDQPMMRHKPYSDVDSCKYGMPYRKRTRIWNNLNCWFSKSLYNRDCNSMMDDRKRHKEVAQRASPIHQNDGDPDNRRRWRQGELY